MFASLAAFFLGGPFAAFAYEISFAETGYKPTAGMTNAIHYEIKQLIARHEKLFQRKAPEKFEINYRVFLTREEFEKYAASTNKTVSKTLLGYTRPSTWVSKSTGEITRALTVEADHFTATAREKIEAAGGTATIAA